ncbi:4-hydroxy-tetrahydrodipicolinate synthase [Abyssisolibacter fermentans]|uniref:4-hydroxy-tetrahydrodipicolinate synthase n=1 Tax=Abyssisolibacter fermentans TaxID=1766203 RepID=UPI0008295F5D|nr:4-hydroxy-tetrahydrodipicolinate synthase [Abyssisolibacter fermentans]
MSLFTGSGVAIVTPFKNSKINYNKLGELIDMHINKKTDAIIICGTTGEASTMTNEEQMNAIKFAVEKTNKRIPVIAGTGSNNTKHAIEMSRYAESVGVDGLLVVTPYYNKTTQKGLIAHYTAIADAVNIPIIIYNVPGRTGLNILPQTILELSKHPNIKGVKEASGNIEQVAEIARLCPKDFYIYSGNDDMILPLLALGGKGVISVIANILPKETHNMVELFMNGNINEAIEIQLNMKALINALFIETNPIPIKTAMNLLNMDAGNLRLPLVDMTASNLHLLQQELINYGLLPRR